MAVAQSDELIWLLTRYERSVLAARAIAEVGQQQRKSRRVRVLHPAHFAQGDDWQGCTGPEPSLEDLTRHADTFGCP